jgi:hypothetical protein
LRVFEDWKDYFKTADSSRGLVKLSQLKPFKQWSWRWAEGCMAARPWYLGDLSLSTFYRLKKSSGEAKQIVYINWQIAQRKEISVSIKPSSSNRKGNHKSKKGSKSDQQTDFFSSKKKKKTSIPN